MNHVDDFTELKLIRINMDCTRYFCNFCELSWRNDYKLRVKAIKEHFTLSHQKNLQETNVQVIHNVMRNQANVNYNIYGMSNTKLNQFQFHAMTINEGDKQQKIVFQLENLDKKGIKQLHMSSYAKNFEQIKKENKEDRLQKVDESLVYVEPDLYKLRVKQQNFKPYNVVRCSSELVYVQADQSQIFEQLKHSLPTIKQKKIAKKVVLEKTESQLGCQNIKLPDIQKQGIKPLGKPHVYHKKLKYNDDY